jgi:hypothetical protein
MAKRKEMFSEEEKRTESGVKRLEDTTDPALERRLHQDLTLSKGEREKGASPAYAMGKKVQRREK